MMAVWMEDYAAQEYIALTTESDTTLGTVFYNRCGHFCVEPENALDQCCECESRMKMCIICRVGKRVTKKAG